MQDSAISFTDTETIDCQAQRFFDVITGKMMQNIYKIGQNVSTNPQKKVF